MVRPLRGVLGPVTTPFDRASGELALDRFAANLRAHIASGLDGILVAGSTGEAALLDESERHLLIETARRIVPTDRWLLAGVGAESTRLTIRRAKDAAAGGADAALVVSPHYYTAAMTPEALRGHFRRVADASPIPLILYNIPKYAHFAIPADVVAELARHGNVIGLKDSSGDLDLLRGYLPSQSDRFTVLVGSGPMLLAALELGARGGILGVSLYAWALTCEVYRAHVAGDAAAARIAHDRVLAAAKEIVVVLGVPAVKAALDAVGLYGGPVRSPLLDLDPASVQRVKALVDGINAGPSRSTPPGVRAVAAARELT